MSTTNAKSDADNKFPHLAQPGQLGALKLNNRVLISSLTRNRADPTTNAPSDAMVKYYQQRAKSTGAGMILTEATMISPQGSEWPRAPGIWSDEQVAGWKKVIDAVHSEGTQIVVQLWHFGRVTHNDMPLQVQSGRPVWSPSDVPARGGKYRDLPGAPGHSVPVAMTVENINAVLDDYERAAQNAKRAGFDGVELHGANGYLPDQFLNDISNVRTDSYGGSPENRSRFALEALQRLIKVYGADRVGVKVAPAGGYNDMYYTSKESLHATFHHYSRELNKLGLAYVQLSQYNSFGDPDHVGYDHDVVKEYGPDLSATPLIAGCGYDGPRAEDEVASGRVTAVAFGQFFIGNPDFSYRIQHGLSVNKDLNFQGFYQILDGDIEKGYSDYPFAAA